MPEASWLLFCRIASLVLITTCGQGMIRIVCHWSVVKAVKLRWCSPRRSRTQPDLRYSGQHAVTRTRPRLGLALGSGSARGWSHIGIVGALAERGLRPDVIAGASVGALVGAACAAGRLERTRTLGVHAHPARRLAPGRHDFSRRRRDDRQSPDAHDRQADRRRPDRKPCHSPSAPSATDLYTGEEIWLREGSFMAAVRASSGLPGLLAPTWHQQRWLIDGGVVNPVPVSLCRALGADLVIAVDLRRSLTTMAMRAARRRYRQSGSEQGSW
jgi:NTE family protein